MQEGLKQVIPIVVGLASVMAHSWIRSEKSIKLIRGIQSIQGGIDHNPPPSPLLARRLKTFISCYRAPGPQKVSEGFLKGSLKGFFLSQPKDPSTPLQNAFKNPSRGLEISSRVQGSCSRK